MEETKSILHELYVYSEWKPEPEYLQKPDNILPENISTFWKWLKFFGPKKSLFDSVTAHKENQQKWHIALGDEGKVIAIVADNILEIRTKRSEYATIAARTTVARDPYPQWRKLVWSPDCSFLVLAYGNGVVSFFDLTASNLFNIPADCSRPGGLECTDNTHAVVDIIFMPLRVKDNKWSYEVAIITYDGMVRHYLVSMARHGPAARGRLASAVSSVAYVAQHACLLVATVPSEQNPNSPLGAGLTSWRILNDEPYYKLSVVSDALETQLANKQFQLYVPFLSRKNMVFIVEMALSPDQSKLVCLHCNGEVSVWSLPLLKLLYRYPLATQPQHDLRNPLLEIEKPGKKDSSLFLPAGVNWWSNEEIILSRFSGVVTVCQIKDMVNILGKKPEFFQGTPRVSCAHHGTFMVLECECSIAPAKKSTSDESMEVVKVEEDLEDSLLETGKELIKSILYAITDMETFQPKPKRISVATRIYRLLGVKSTTPQDLFARKIESGSYKEALALAETFGLDSDQVYQQQWRKNPVSMEAIQNYLSKVSSKIWAVHQCVDRLPETLSAAHALLQCGLERCNLHILEEINKDREEPISDPEDITLEDLNAYTSELLRCRHVMLFYKERLALYEAILKAEKSTYDKAEYDRLRSSSVVHSAAEIAKEGRIEALACLWPQIRTVAMQLAVLEKLPETINPLEYQHLLPTKQPIELFEKRSPIKIPPSEYEHDWCRKEIFRSIWSSNWSEDSTPDADAAASDAEMSKWYERRAREIEARSGLVSHALTLVTLAGVGGAVAGLDDVAFHLLTLDTLIYDRNVEDVTLPQVENMSPLEMCVMLMKPSTPATFVSDLKQFVVPFLKRHESLSQRQDACLYALMEYLEHISINDLSYILLVLQSPSEFELDVRTHLELAERCLFAYEGTQQLELACDLLQTILQESDGSISSSELVRRVSRAQRVVAGSARLLERGVRVPWRDLRSPAAADAVAVMKRAANVRDDEKRTKEDWDKLLSDLLELQETIFGSVPVEEVYEIYASAVLTSGDAASIKLAAAVLTTSHAAPHRVPLARSVVLVSQAAAQYFNSASSLTDPQTQLAKCCLQLIKEDNPEIKQELDLISALQILSKFNVERLPVQVRLCEDKMELLQACLKEPGAYNDSHQLLQLAELLRIGTDPIDRESQVLQVILTTALDAGAAGSGAVTAAARRLAELRARAAAPLLCRVAAVQRSAELQGAALALLPASQLPAAAEFRLQLELESLQEVCAALKEHNKELEKQQSTDDEFSDAVTTPVIEKKDLLAPPKSGKSQPLFSYLMNTLQNKFAASQSAAESPPDESIRVPEFYRALYNHQPSDGYRYDSFSSPDSQHSPLTVLNCYYTQSCVQQCYAEDLEMDILQQCAEQYLYRDTAFSVGCLLRTTQDAAKADSFIDSHCTNTGLSCATYAALIKCNSCELRAATYITTPSQLAKITLKERNASQEQLDLIRKCIDKLSGAGEGDALRNLGFTVNSIMFNTAPEYRSELIHKVARSSEKEHVLTALQLANKYELDTLGVWLAHACAAALDARPLLAPPPRVDGGAARIQQILWPEIAGTDHAGLIQYFTALRTLDDKIQVQGLTPDAHIKLLKKVKSCQGLDYKLLISNSEQLAPHLVTLMASNSLLLGTVPRLLRALPLPLQALPPQPLLRQALYKLFLQVPEQQATNKKWMQQWRQVASYFSKLSAAGLLALCQDLCFSDEAIRRIRGSTRALMLLQAAEYCAQEQESENRPAHLATSEEPSWAHVAQQLTSWSAFLERLHAPPVQALVERCAADVQSAWVEIEKSRGVEAPLLSALWRCCVATRAPRAVVRLHAALSEAPARALAAHALTSCQWDKQHVETLVELLIEFHKEGTIWDDALIRAVLDLACEHALPPHTQIALLSLSDKGLARETGDMLTVAKYCVELFRSEWQDCDYAKNITEDQLLTPGGRIEVFNKLLALGNSWQRKKALVDVLSCWPATVTDSGRSLHCEFLASLVSSDGLVLIKLMLPSNSLQPEEMRWISENSQPSSAVNVVWALLLQKHQRFQEDIVKTVTRHKETVQDQEIDDELIKGLLDSGMFLKLVPTPLYSSIITYIITREAAGEPSSAYTVKWATEQLVKASLFAEAGHLYLTSLGVPPPLLGFSQSVQYAKNILKK